MGGGGGGRFSERKREGVNDIGAPPPSHPQRQRVPFTPAFTLDHKGQC